MVAGVKHMHDRNVSEPIRCVVDVKPVAAQRHKKEMLRYFLFW